MLILASLCTSCFGNTHLIDDFYFDGSKNFETEISDNARQVYKNCFNLTRKLIFQFLADLKVQITKTTYSCAMNPDHGLLLIRISQNIFSLFSSARQVEAIFLET